MKNKKVLLFIIPFIIVVIALATFLPLFSINKLSTKSKQFINDGYVIAASNINDSNNVNTQYSFASGSKYQKTYDKKASFTDINGNKVVIDENSFLHYADGSMNGLSSSVLLNTDEINSPDQIAYYSVPEESLLQKSGSSYIVSNAGNNLTLSNFIWKESNQLYMVVSEEIKLVVGEGIQQTFKDYVELQYNDEGIAHLVNQDGTYSTISSDAYLSLSNGIRIYIGSKNVSNDETVLMNLTQMVVDSEDNVEIIPDENYTIENKNQPQIVINATDGVKGENGESGENGDNGENGAPGVQGTKGNNGTSDEKADVIYAPEKVPVFDNLKITPNAFGFDATMNYASNDCDVASAYISINNDKTGQEVWTYTLKNDDGSINLLAKNISITCTALDPSTQYTYVVYANWAPLVGDQHYNQSLLQQSFVTSSLGLDLTYYSADDNSINMKIKKNMDTVITEVKVELFDNFKEQMMPNVFASVVSTNIENVTISQIYDEVTKTIDVSDMKIGDEIEVRFENLNPNTIYYAKLLIQKNSSGSVIPDVFEKIKVITLKRLPFLEAPSGEYLTQMNAFKISSGSIRDYDGGITSYRYDVYTNDSEHTLVYSLAKSLPNEINVDVSNNQADPVHREKEYIAQLVAIFDDNEKVVEVPSSFSTPFASGDIAWPMATFDYTTEHITASTIEGNFVITDANFAIQSGSIITIEATAATSTSSDYVMVAQAKVNYDPIANEYSCEGMNGITCTYNAAQKTYSIPVKMQGLKQATTYNFEISATTIKTANETGSHISSRAISTKTYEPVRIVEDIKEHPNNAKFEIDLYFAALDPVKEANKDITKYASEIATSLIDFSGKAMSYLRIEVYKADQVYDYPARYNPGELIGFVDIYDTDIDLLDREGQVNKGNNYAHSVYDFSSSIYRRAYLDSKKYVQYLNNPDAMQLKDCVIDGANPLKITDALFSEDIRKELTAGNNYMLKVSVLNDYCYGDGSNYFNYVQMARNGDIVTTDESIKYKVINPIQVGTNQGSDTYGGYNQTKPSDDQWVLFSISDQLPAVPQENDSLDIVYQNTVLQYLLSNSNAYNPDGYINNGLTKDLRNSNIYKSVLFEDAPGADNTVKYQNFLNGYTISGTATKGFLEANINSVKNDTAVGVAYSGPKELAEHITRTTPSADSNFSQYASAPYPDSSVLYTVYKVDENGHEIKITDSGWLTYLYHKDLNPKLPTYTFFFDLEDATTGLAIHRGEEFKIRTQVRLKLDEVSQVENDFNIIYPASVYTYYDRNGIAYYDVGGARFETSPGVSASQLYYNSVSETVYSENTPSYKKKVYVNADTPEQYEWHISRNAYAEKCVPDILSVLYSGSKVGKDTVYLSIFDPDDYLTKDALGNVTYFYKNPESLSGYSAFTDVEYYTDNPSDKTLPNGITHRIKLSLDNDDYLYYKYHVHKYDIDNSIIDEDRYIPLLSQKGITDTMRIAFPSAASFGSIGSLPIVISGISYDIESPVSIILKDQKAYVAFAYQMVDSSNTPISLAAARTFFEGPEGGDFNTPVVASSLVLKNYESDETTVINTQRLNKKIENTSLIDKNGVHYFVAYSTIDLPDIVDLIKTNGSEKITCDVNLYYDNGSFGYSNQVGGSGYYLLEMLNAGSGSSLTNRGIGLNESGNVSGYPDTVYIKNSSNSTSDKFLFSKTNGQVSFNTNDKVVTIGGESYYYDKYGITYTSNTLAIAKGVSSVTATGETNEITNVFSVPVTTIDSGYSSILINMIMSNSHTLITKDSVLPAPYNPDDYPLSFEYSMDLDTFDNDNNLNRSRVDLEIEASTTKWEDIFIKKYMDFSDPSHPEGVEKDILNNSTFYYNVYGWYMNDGVPTKVALLSEPRTMETITSYKHDVGTLTYSTVALEGANTLRSRNSKTLDYKFTITNREGAVGTPSIIKEDFINSIKYLTFYLIKEDSTTNVELNYKKVNDNTIDLANGDVVTTQWEGDNIDMPELGIIAAKTITVDEVITGKTISGTTYGFIENPTSEIVGYINYLNEFNFAPADEHEFGDGYAVLVEYVYKNGRDILADTDNPLDYHVINQGGQNATSHVANRATVTAEPIYEPEGGFILNFTISGNEWYRLMPTYDNRISYIVELHDALTNEVVNYGGTDEHPENNFARKYVETKFYSNGYSFQPINIRFDNLKPNHQYYANVYFMCDRYNIGLENKYHIITENLVTSNDVPTNILQTQENPEVIRKLTTNPTINLTLSECLDTNHPILYTKKSDIFRTSLTSDTVVQAVYFNAISDDGAYFLAFGVNLSNILRIEYDYRIGEEELVTGRSVIFDPVNHTGDFVESSDGVYSLKLSEINDPTVTYSTIVIRFYVTRDPGDAGLVSTIIKENIHN